MSHSTYTKVARCIGVRDYEASVNGEIIGYAPSSSAAMCLCDDYVLAQIEHGPVAELVEQERQAGVIEAQPAPVPVETTAADLLAPASVRRHLPATAAEIARAVHAARQELTEPAAIRAVNRAYEELLHGMWIYDGERLIIPSRTTAGERYTATADECECLAHAHGRICWHRAAFIAVQMASAAAVLAQPAPTTPAQRLAEADVLYAALGAAGDASDLSPVEAREILTARTSYATA